MPYLPSSEDLKRLLPAGVQAVVSTQAPNDEGLQPAIEKAGMDSMQPVRRSEFIHGRACARAALTAMNFPNQAIPVGTSREPVWPDGIVGSISHCGSVAAAVTARQKDLSALGIDLESACPLDEKLLPMICRAEEKDSLKESAQPLLIAKLIFSAKESIYKCIWPSVRQFVDFQEIGISIDQGAGSFVPVTWADHLPPALMARIAGRYLLCEGWIITTAYIPPIAVTSGTDS